MKKIILLFIGFAVLSCTSSDNDDNTPLPDAFTIDGVSAVEVQKSISLVDNNYYVVSISDLSDPTRLLHLSFSKYGNLISAGTSTNSIEYENYPYFSSNYFSFEMSEADSEGNFTVDFSGKVYQNKTDMNSAFKTISGHIKFQTIVEYPEEYWTTKMGVYADVDGKDWFSRFTNSSHAYDSGYWTSYFISDDNFRLVFNMSGSSTVNGVYNFTPASEHDWIRVEKFNTATLSYEPWNTQGTFTITGRHQPFQGEYYMDGTFSLTATNPLNPAEVVHFNNGVMDALDL